MPRTGAASAFLHFNRTSRAFGSSAETHFEWRVVCSRMVCGTRDLNAASWALDAACCPLLLWPRPTRWHRSRHSWVSRTHMAAGHDVHALKHDGRRRGEGVWVYPCSRRVCASTVPRVTIPLSRRVTEALLCRYHWPVRWEKACPAAFCRVGVHKVTCQATRASRSRSQTVVRRNEKVLAYRAVAPTRPAQASW
jgi:hypothetical protein